MGESKKANWGDESKAGDITVQSTWGESAVEQDTKWGDDWKDKNDKWGDDWKDDKKGGWGDEWKDEKDENKRGWGDDEEDDGDGAPRKESKWHEDNEDTQFDYEGTEEPSQVFDLRPLTEAELNISKPLP